MYKMAIAQQEAGSWNEEHQELFYQLVDAADAVEADCEVVPPYDRQDPNLHGHFFGYNANHEQNTDIQRPPNSLDEEDWDEEGEEDDEITYANTMVTNDEDVANLVEEFHKKCGFTKHTRKRDSNWEKVRQEVTCAICLELLDDPKSMPCLHTYCKKCLMEALAKQPHDPDLPQDRPAINCPLCRAEVALSDQGIEALPTNFSAVRLVETVKLQDKLEENNTQKCDNCFAHDAIAICYECGRFFLCPNCFKVHKQLPSTKHHSILSLNQFMQSNVPVLTANKSLLCQTHPQELLKLYCEECEALLCRDCVLVKHKTHNYSFVDEIIEEEKEHLQNVTLKDLEHILASTKEAITGVEQLQAKVLSCNDDNVAQLNKCFQEITSLLNSRKRDFLDEVRKVSQNYLCPLQKQQEDLMTLKQKVESCRDFTQKTLHGGINTEIMSAKKQMLERSKHLQELHNSSPLAPVAKPSTTIFYQMDKIKEVVESLGVIIDIQQCYIEDIPDKIFVDVLVSIRVVLKDTKGQPICNASKAITVKVTPVIVADNSVTPVIEELKNGIYAVLFAPKRYRNHIVSIQINGNHISESPFELETASIYTQQTEDKSDSTVACVGKN